MRMVVKFGGTSLATPELVSRAAAKVRTMARGHQVAVVVSAMGDTTRKMMDLLKGVGRRESTLWEVSEVIGLGEVISARLLAIALRKAGAKARAVTPESDAWPVVAGVIGDGRIEEEKVNQEPLAAIRLGKTTELCSKKILPLMEKKIIPVLCGFLARDDQGRLVVLGRGGSDISAVALGRCLAADRVIIVTDVPGVLMADPKVIPTKRSIARMSVDEVESLARGGARVIHPSSLQYKLPDQQIFIVDFGSRSFLKGGTEIVGTRQAEVMKTPGALACITVVGKDFIRTHGLLHAITDRLSRLKISIYGVSASETFIAIYVRQEHSERSYAEIFEEVKRQPKFSAVSVMKGIGRLRLSSPAFIEQPGIIGRIGDLLAMKGINIIEMVTIQTDITIFIAVADLPKAFSLLKAFSF